MKPIMTTVLGLGLMGAVVLPVVPAMAAGVGTGADSSVDSNMRQNSGMPGGRAKSTSVNTTGDILSEGGAATMPVSGTEVSATTHMGKKKH